MAKRKSIVGKPSAAAEKELSPEVLALAGCPNQCTFQCGADKKWHKVSDPCPGCNCTCTGNIEGQACSGPGMFWHFPCQSTSSLALAAAAKAQVPEPDHVVTVLPGQSVQVRYIT